jgi:hypothetical protein
MPLLTEWYPCRAPRVPHRLGTNAAFAPQYATRARGAGPATALDGAVAALTMVSTTGSSGDCRSRDPPTVRSAALGANSDRVDAALASRQPAVEPVGKEIDRVIEFDRAGLAYAPAHFAFHFVLDQRFTERFGGIGCCRRRNRRAQGTAVQVIRLVQSVILVRNAVSCKDAARLRSMTGSRNHKQSATLRDCSEPARKSATEFQDRCLKPLGHPSQARISNIRISVLPGPVSARKGQRQALCRAGIHRNRQGARRGSYMPGRSPRLSG